MAWSPDGVGACSSPEHTSGPGEEGRAGRAGPAADQNPGQEKKAENAASSSGINGSDAGVKPSNDTKKNTTCWTGGSSSSPTCQPGSNADSSKRYGNGKTAARIAASRGAPAGTEIRGPGNSQPHKVCGKNGHFIDVHAVKSYTGLDCTATAATTATQQQQSRSEGTVTSNSSSSASTSNSTGVTASTSQTGSTSGGTGAAGGVAGTSATGGVGTSATGGVAGVSAESGSPQSGGANGDAGGVLGAFGVAGVAAGALPFTGFPLWFAILVAITLIAAGWTLHRRGRPATRDLV